MRCITASSTIGNAPLLDENMKYVILKIYIGKDTEPDLLDFLVKSRKGEKTLGEVAHRLLREYMLLMSWEDKKRMIKRNVKKQLRKRV